MGEFPLYFHELLINIVSLSWQPLSFFHVTPYTYPPAITGTSVH